MWFRTTGVPIPSNNDGCVGPGLDVKAEDGYLFVPPSLHPDGVVYRWLNDEPLAVVPEWLEALARKPPPHKAEFGLRLRHWRDGRQETHRRYP